MLDPMRNDGAPSCMLCVQTKVKRSRKGHTCGVCKVLIPAGSPYIRAVTKTTDDRAPWAICQHVDIGECLRNLDA